MIFQAKPKFVISEPDIQAAVSHLRSLPFRPEGPASWDRQYVIDQVREALTSKTKVGDFLEVGPGVYGIVKPFGVDLAGGPHGQGRLQVWIAIRSAGSDPTNVVEL